MLRFTTLLFSGPTVVYRRSSAYLLAAIIPFSVLTSLRLIDIYVLALHQKAIHHLTPIIAPYDPLPILDIIWDLFYFIPAAAYGASVVRITLSGPDNGLRQRLATIRQADLQFVLTAFVGVMALAPLLFAARWAGWIWLELAVPPIHDYLPNRYDYYLGVHLVLVIFTSATVWWAGISFISFRLVTLAASTHHPLPPVFAPLAPAVRLFGAAIILWFVTETVSYGLRSALPSFGYNYTYYIALNIFVLLQVALIMATAAIAWDVDRRSLRLDTAP